MRGPPQSKVSEMENEFKEQFKDVMKEVKVKSFDNAWISYLLRYDRQDPHNPDKYVVISRITSGVGPGHVEWDTGGNDDIIPIYQQRNQFFLSYADLAEHLQLCIAENEDMLALR